MRFRILNKNPLYDYREACKITQGIDLWQDLDIDKIFVPKDEVAFWIKQIVANHSTIRSVKFRLEASAPKSVVMQIIRATKGHPQPFVESSRPDWKGKERSPDPYEEKMFIMDFTAESFVEMCKQRLCHRTEERTEKFVREVVETLKRSDEPFLKAVGYCCRANCWWHGGRCPEIKSCLDDVRKVSNELIAIYEIDSAVRNRGDEE